MHTEPQEPLSIRHRHTAFLALVTLFVVLIPFLYLYATGYRIQLGGTTNIVSTGGMYIAAEREGTAIYIDDEIVPESRVFRQAFYAQSLVPKTHRVTVQREGFHTWVKELPVYAHIVTEAEAFNLPLVPRARVITPLLITTPDNDTGLPVATSSLLVASTTNPLYIATTTTITEQTERNQEFGALIALFATSTTDADVGIPGINLPLLQPATTTATSTDTVATTTKESRGVRLYESDNRLFARWVGAGEQMPYYYCAEPFARYSTTTSVAEGDIVAPSLISLEQVPEEPEVVEFIHPIQTVADDSTCEPIIEIGPHYEPVRYFDFFLGNTNLVLLVLNSGVYVVEVDNRAWQNMQPLVRGAGLDARIENGSVYVYDGTLIYQMILEE
ncbi:MAG: hypothetical protein LR017_01330 [Candidatus Pacebacteria bacterium]|nr:hypothetical protein [Candidatus Paceibacterota bacterium]